MRPKRNFDGSTGKGYETRSDEVVPSRGISRFLPGAPAEPISAIHLRRKAADRLQLHSPTTPVAIHFKDRHQTLPGDEVTYVTTNPRGDAQLVSVSHYPEEESTGQFGEGPFLVGIQREMIRRGGKHSDSIGGPYMIDPYREITKAVVSYDPPGVERVEPISPKGRMKLEEALRLTPQEQVGFAVRDVIKDAARKIGKDNPDTPGERRFAGTLAKSNVSLKGIVYRVPFGMDYLLRARVGDKDFVMFFSERTNRPPEVRFGAGPKSVTLGMDVVPDSRETAALIREIFPTIDPDLLLPPLNKEEREEAPEIASRMRQLVRGA